MFADRAVTESEQIRRRDSYGAGGTKARRGRKGSEASAIQAESSSVWQLKGKFIDRKFRDPSIS